jgi:hypothetical protein
VASPDTQTVAEAKKYLFDHAMTGTKCPCCGLIVHVRKRTLHRSKAIVIVLLEKYARVSGDAYVHVNGLISVAPELSPRERAKVRGDWTRLAAWGLVEQMQTKKRSGFWRISHNGRLFVGGRLRVPSHHYFFNQQLVAVDDGSTETLDIEEALGEVSLADLLNPV